MCIIMCVLVFPHYWLYTSDNTSCTCMYTYIHVHVHVQGILIIIIIILFSNNTFATQISVYCIVGNFHTI